MSESTTNNERLSPFLTVCLLTALMIFAAGSAWQYSLGLNFIVVSGTLCVFVMVLGKVITGRSSGILINERKLMSLSRLQAVLWTVIVLAAYFVIAIHRIVNGASDPLLIEIDKTVWMVLGISGISLVGTPMLYGRKRQKEPADKSLVKKAATAFKVPDAELDKNREGILWGNQSVTDARFTDIFEGDELGNAAYIDVAKVQMFFFTALVGFAYCVEAYQLIAHGNLLGSSVAIPSLDDSVLALMGVSHAGYLGSKAVDHTASAMP